MRPFIIMRIKMDYHTARKLLAEFLQEKGALDAYFTALESSGETGHEPITEVNYNGDPWCFMVDEFSWSDNDHLLHGTSWSTLHNSWPAIYKKADKEKKTPAPAAIPSTMDHVPIAVGSTMWAIYMMVKKGHAVEKVSENGEYCYIYNKENDNFEYLNNDDMQSSIDEELEYGDSYGAEVANDEIFRYDGEWILHTPPEKTIEEED